MAPSPIPAPLPPWVKVVIELGGLTLPTAVRYLYDLVTHKEEAAPGTTWRTVQCVFTPTWTGVAAQDNAIVTFDLANITGGHLDDTWTDTDFTTCEAKLDTFWTAWGSRMATGAKLTSYRWYRRSFNSVDDPDKRFNDAGPPVRVTTKSIGSGAIQGMPSQVAITITERTGFPRHWGRLYLPFPDTAQIDSGGRVSSTTRTNVTTAFQTLYNDLQLAEFYPVVPVTQVNKQWFPALLTVEKIVMDDIFDVIRRRRIRNVLTRTIKP